MKKEKIRKRKAVCRTKISPDGIVKLFLYERPKPTPKPSLKYG